MAKPIGLYSGSKEEPNISNMNLASTTNKVLLGGIPLMDDVSFM